MLAEVQERRMQKNEWREVMCPGQARDTLSSLELSTERSKWDMTVSPERQKMMSQIPLLTKKSSLARLHDHLGMN